MRKFLGGIWRAIDTTKSIIGNLFFIVVVVVIIAAVWSQSRDVFVPDDAALVLHLNGTIVEQRRVVDPFVSFFSGGNDEDPETLLTEVIDAISNARDDERITLLVLDVNDLQSASLSELQTIGQSLEAFKSSGKPIYAYGDGFTQAQYYLAAHADHLYLNEHAVGVFSGVFLTGFGSYPVFVKSALEKLKVNAHVFQAGEFKSAAEPFLRDDLSPAAQSNLQNLVDSLWEDYLNQVASLRNTTPAALSAYIDTYATRLADHDSDAGALAVSQGLVDERLNQQQWLTRLQALVGDNNGGFRQVGMAQYLSATQTAIPVVSPGADKIAVITAEGAIYAGEQPPGTIGADSLSSLIKKARDNATVKALVLRINSPGGSAAASEQIRYELEMTQQAGKPVVVSMGATAASGGYWISATADRIIATPTTVTGSIGVISIFPTFEQSMAAVGVYSDGVGTTPLSGAFNPLTALSPAMEQLLDLTNRRVYKDFINLVAQGRNMSHDAVDAIAQGQVWSGKAALTHGLVDELGDLDFAIQQAAELASISDYETFSLQTELTPTERLIREILTGSAATAAQSLGINDLRLPAPLVNQFGDLVRFSQTPGQYLFCVTCGDL